MVDVNDTVIDYWKTDVPFIDAHNITTAMLKSSLVRPVLKEFTYRDFKNTDINGLNGTTEDCAVCGGADELEARLSPSCTHSTLIFF